MFCSRIDQIFQRSRLNRSALTSKYSYEKKQKELIYFRSNVNIRKNKHSPMTQMVFIHISYQVGSLYVCYTNYGEDIFYSRPMEPSLIKTLMNTNCKSYVSAMNSALITKGAKFSTICSWFGMRKKYLRAQEKEKIKPILALMTT